MASWDSDSEFDDDDEQHEPDLTEAQIYLDYNATTPLAPSVLEITTKVLRDAWGNPSSSYESGRKAKQEINTARAHLAAVVGAKDPKDILFVSGGTEANNMVCHSAVQYFAHWSAASKNVDGVAHVVTTNIEHDSVILTLRALESMGIIQLTEAAVNQHGFLEPSTLLAALKPTTILVSVMLANNETGVIQPVAELVEVAKTYETQRANDLKVLFHTDAAQAIGKIGVDVDQLKVDYLTIVGHKFYGPRIGALYCRGLSSSQTPLFPMFFGGGQEHHLRPGTENTAMIAGLGEAARLVVESLNEYASLMQATRDYFELKLILTFGPDKVAIHGKSPRSSRLPNTCNFSLVGNKYQSHKVLSKVVFCASKGAACHSENNTEPSPIILALGVAPAIASNAIRLSVGRETTFQHIDFVVANLKQVIKSL